MPISRHARCIRRAISPRLAIRIFRSEEHTSELQSLMRNSYALFCLKKKNNKYQTSNDHSGYTHDTRTIYAQPQSRHPQLTPLHSTISTNTLEVRNLRIHIQYKQKYES